MTDINLDLDEPEDDLKVLEGIELKGDINTPMEEILAHITHAIRQGHPQVQHQALQHDRVALVGSGPSLEATLPALRALVFEGAKVVTVNGAYHWCIEHNIRPSAQIVLDAKPSTARFLEPAVPQCFYFAASQCHGDVWRTLAQRERTFIWHSVNPKYPERPVLDAYYGPKQWTPIPGGTTVVTRALTLLRTIGYLRFDLFGIDCCWLGGKHHAFDQPENAKDRRFKFTVVPARGELTPRRFVCSPWMMKQAEDVLQMVRVNGDSFLLNIHGDGMLAYMFKSGADVVVSEEVAAV
jgi:hypothetical protein